MTNKPKDRSTHQAARGKKLPSIHDLTCEKPEIGDVKEYLKTLMEVDDRSCAIMGGALVEECLEIAIRCRILDPGKTIADGWFRGPNAPFGTFSAKIQMGLALAIYGPQNHGRILAVKDIRNAFAHRFLPLDFDHPALMASLHKFAPFLKGSTETNMKLIFATGCVVQARSLMEDAVENGGKVMTPSVP
ncbi:MAG: hypothetical protein MT490_18095 [Sphingomonas sp.]|uniref:hypothetical protein n=1 Tax=Sphingomonas sp. TaxID=28214 RepID=UPI002276F8C8|nr:hypothetical protein [Sphingomonas sp.]MCX8477705.1 hypothetical protein [Sphingomonas sp.]